MLPETLEEKSNPRTTMLGFRATLNDRDILHKAARDRGDKTVLIYFYANKKAPSKCSKLF